MGDRDVCILSDSAPMGPGAETSLFDSAIRNGTDRSCSLSCIRSHAVSAGWDPSAPPLRRGRSPYAQYRSRPTVCACHRSCFFRYMSVAPANRSMMRGSSGSVIPSFLISDMTCLQTSVSCIMRHSSHAHTVSPSFGRSISLPNLLSMQG